MIKKYTDAAKKEINIIRTIIQKELMHDQLTPDQLTPLTNSFNRLQLMTLNLDAHAMDDLM